jgi:hypothetical protein
MAFLMAPETSVNRGHSNGLEDVRSKLPLERAKYELPQRMGSLSLSLDLSQVSNIAE